MELVYGVARKSSAKLERLIDFIEEIKVVDFDSAVAQRSGRLRAELESMGISIAVPNCQIAIQALSDGLILVSADKIFTRIPDLVVENWRTTKP